MKAKKISTNNYEVTAKPYPLYTGGHEELIKYRVDLQKIEDNHRTLMDHFYKNRELKVLKAVIMAQHERIKELGGFDK